MFPFETNQFENALKVIKTKTHTYCNSVEDRKRIKMKTMTENITGACDFSMRIEFNLRHNVQFYRFLTFEWGQSKTHENGRVDENRSIRFRGQRISVERALEVNRVYLEGFENGHFQINKLLKNGLETCTYNKCVREEFLLLPFPWDRARASTKFPIFSHPKKHLNSDWVRVCKCVEQCGNVTYNINWRLNIKIITVSKIIHHHFTTLNLHSFK